jgi:hypothetical protein
VATAVNCWGNPSGADAATGVTAIDTIAAGATVRVVELDIEPEVALIFAAPVAALVASPMLSELLLMIATVAGDEVQVTMEVTFGVVPSL